MTPRLRALYLADTMADVRMLEGLAAHCDVTLLAPSALGDRATTFWPPRPPAHVDRVLLGGGRAGFAARAAWWTRRNRARFDVVVALDNLTAALAANLARAGGGPPVVLQVGRPTVEYVRCQGRPARTLAAAALVAVNERAADGLGAVSEYVAAACRRRNCAVRFIPWYGVDTARFSPSMPRAEARRRLDLPPRGAVVMLRSRIAPEKDPVTFLRAIDILRARGREITAVYMGGELEEIRRLAAGEGVEIVAGKPSSADEIPLWYVAADVCVQTSRAEGLGVSPLEALACGTPVVVSDVGGLREVVDGGRVGGLVPPGDPAALAAEVARLLDDPARAARQAVEGRAWVEARFTSHAAFEAWADVLRSAAQGGRDATGTARRVLFVDHETRLSGGQRDLVDLVGAFPPGLVEAHAALPGEGPLAHALRRQSATVHTVHVDDRLRTVSRWELGRRPWTALRHLGAATRAACELARLARRLRPDVVHTNSMKAHLLAAPAALACGARRAWHVRDVLPPGWLRWAFGALAALLAQRVVVISEAAAVAFHGTPAAGRVRVVHNGIRSHPASGSDSRAWREKLGADDGDVLVGIVGQIARWKGQDVFVEAAGLLAQRRPDMRFAVVGECLFPENEAAFDRQLRERAAELGLDDRLRFVGHVEPVEPVMAALDVLVHASRLPEPFGRVIVEAMAQGTPVLTTTGGAGPELVGTTAGSAVPPGDPAVLADALGRLTADRPARAAMARAARARAASFDLSTTARGVLGVYEEIDP